MLFLMLNVSQKPPKMSLQNERKIQETNDEGQIKL